MKTERSRSFLSALLLFSFFLFSAPFSSAQDASSPDEEDQAEMSADEEGSEGDTAMSEEADSAEADSAAKDTAASAADEGSGDTEVEEKETEQTMHQLVKQKFIEGDPRFMAFVLICLIVGLALSIERIIYLNMSSTNTEKLLNRVEHALANGGVEEAKKVCRETKGPIASIFYQGLDRSGEGIEVVEKSVISYGGVQMGLLEKGLSWIQLFIAIAPMLGFMGTVFGMISAFDSIAAENNISPQIVASGIQQALITTVSGLMVGILLQVFYNYIVAKVDSMVNEMESASISLVDLLVKHDITQRNDQ